MPICIECCYPVSQLYHVLHSRHHKSVAPTPKTPVPNLTGASSSQKATANAQNATESKFKTKNTIGGGDVRLTQCPRCKRFADKYVEHDFVVLFIDLVLVKPQVSGPLETRTSSRALDLSIVIFGLNLKIDATYKQRANMSPTPGVSTPPLQSPFP